MSPSSLTWLRQRATECHALANSTNSMAVRTDALRDAALFEQAANDLEGLNSSAADTARLDWLSDRDNDIGQVSLPRQCVERNLHSMRAAIDDAMRMQKSSATELPGLGDSNGR